MILKYLNAKIKDKNSNFQVVELPTESNQNKCFKVGASFHLKEQLHDNKFWPEGVAHKRFDFDRQRSYDKVSPPQNPFLGVRKVNP